MSCEAGEILWDSEPKPEPDAPPDPREAMPAVVAAARAAFAPVIPMAVAATPAPAERELVKGFAPIITACMMIGMARYSAIGTSAAIPTTRSTEGSARVVSVGLFIRGPARSHCKGRG